MAQRKSTTKEKNNRIIGVDGNGASSPEPSYEEIQKKAYEIYEQKGGDATGNWLEAERICRNQK